MRVVTWNLLHGIALTQGESKPGLAEIASQISADIIGLQEVDRNQPRSDHEHQTQVVAQAMGLPHWIFAPQLLAHPVNHGRVRTILTSTPMIICQTPKRSHITELD